MSIEKKEMALILDNFNQGKKMEALQKILLLIKKYPRNLEYHLIYGKMCLQVNNLDEAEKIFLFLLSKNKYSTKYLSNLYITYLKKNDLIKAEFYIKKLLDIDSDQYGALRDLGYIKYLNKNLDEAEVIYRKISKRVSKDVFALNIFGLIYYFKGDLQKAIVKFQTAINLDSKYTDSYNNMGKAYFDLEDLNEAFYNFKRAYKLEKNSFKTLINIGNVLSLKDKNNFAINAYKKALALTNEKATTLSNIAIAYSRNKDLENSIKYYNKISKNGNENPSLNLSLSYLYLYKCNYKKAWELFDYRILNNKFFKNNLNNQVVSYIFKNNIDFDKNDKVLVLREQGLGEEILFSSLYPDLINSGADVTIETDVRLIKIFERSFNKKIFVESGKFSNDIKKIKNFDVVTFAGSLCKKFRKEKEDFLKKSYLKSEKEKDIFINNFNILKDDKLKVGLSWKSVVSVYGNLKSLNILDFKNIFKPNRQIINLQYGNNKDDIKKIQNENCLIETFDQIDLFNDIDGCMSILKKLDILVTVSNSTAHIAAAMGVKTILICPKKSSTYFYWSNEENISPWYKDVTILRIEKSIKETINKVDKILKKYE